MTSMDEEALVHRIARGDRAAFDELYRRTSPWLAVRLRRRCADDELVAEVMQETYLAIWRAAASFSGASVGGSAVGWVWTIAARRLVDALRRRAREGRLPLAALTAPDAPAAEDEALEARVGGRAGLRGAPVVAGPAGGPAGDGSRWAHGARDRRAVGCARGHGEDPGSTSADRVAEGAVMNDEKHVPAAALRRYATGDPRSRADQVWAVEAHLELCARCRERLGEAVTFHSPETAALVAQVQTSARDGGRTKSTDAHVPAAPAGVARGPRRASGLGWS